MHKRFLRGSLNGAKSSDYAAYTAILRVMILTFEDPSDVGSAACLRSSAA